MKTLFLRAFLVVMVFAAGLCFFMGTIEAGSNQDTARKEYADKVRATYNYRFGKDQLAAPGNASIEGDDFVHPEPFPTRSIARIVIRRPTTNGGSRCIPIPFARRSIEPASIFLSGRKASNSHGTAIAATTRLQCWQVA